MGTLSAAPAGLTGLEPIPYGERRWNGSVWPAIQVDRYNAELQRIAERHRAGMDTQHLIDGLYNMAHGFDMAGKPARCSCARHGDGSVTTMLCPAHAETDATAKALARRGLVQYFPIGRAEPSNAMYALASVRRG